MTGIDRPLKQKGGWSFTAELRYLLTIMESEGASEDLDLDPVIPSIGIAYRF